MKEHLKDTSRWYFLLGILISMGSTGNKHVANENLMKTYCDFVLIKDTIQYLLLLMLLFKKMNVAMNKTIFISL